MFLEKGESGNCYKSFAKWENSNGLDEKVNELKYKRPLQETRDDPLTNQALRQYYWGLMSENILTEDPIKFYSA